MSRTFIEDMKPGDRFDGDVFLIAQKDLRTTKSGALYIHAVLKDKSGQMPARMWQATEDMFRSLPDGGFARLWGKSESYQGHMQFVIDAVRPPDPEQIDLDDFLPKTDHDVDQMWKRTLEILRTVSNEHLQGLLKQFVTDADVVARFKRAPAAMNMHHAYLGGLLEHTLSLLELALVVVPRYPELSLDLMLTCVFLHDLGKISELACEADFRYTDRGQLVGHIVEVVIWIQERARASQNETGKAFPEDILAVLQHVVLSHHGTHEFGSPKLPAVPEAIALHHLDNLDAKLHQYVKQINADPDPQSNWTQYQRQLSTKIYKKDVMGVRTFPVAEQAANG